MVLVRRAHRRGRPVPRWRAAVLPRSRSPRALGAAVLLLVDRGTLRHQSPSRDRGSTGSPVCSVHGDRDPSGVRGTSVSWRARVAPRASDRHRALFDGAPIAMFEVDRRDARDHRVDLAARPSSVSSCRPISSPRPRRSRRPRMSTKRRCAWSDSRGRRHSASDRRPACRAAVDALERDRRPLDQEIALEIGGAPRVVVRADLPDGSAHVIVGFADVTEQRRLAAKLHEARRLRNGRVAGRQHRARLQQSADRVAIECRPDGT